MAIDVHIVECTDADQKAEEEELVFIYGSYDSWKSQRWYTYIMPEISK